jgi:hypothetical protein
MFGENDRSLGWVFSRTPTRFRKVIQLPEQIGMPGFWNDGIQ